ncbi:MAG: Gfo/Idh/MocA family oxidoreductase [Gemmatimonadetes bacterium]|nr:Gfo/Idh/MocA family oxidoreductase [Gemmatimonadota bacterium]
MPDTTDPYGVLLLSFSRHSHQRNFVSLYAKHPQTRIVAIADDDTAIDGDLRQLNRLWADQLGVPYVPDVDQALARDDVDIVSIAHDIERRSQLIQASADAGKHLWIDKFLGATLEEYDAAIDAIERAGVTAIVPSYAYGSLLRQARPILESGALGELLGCHVDLHFAKGMPRTIDRCLPFLGADEGTWKYPELKRELLTIGSYSVGLLQAALGAATRVHGTGGAHFFPEHAARGADDFAALTLIDDEGRLGTLSAGRVGLGSHPAGGPSRAWLVGSEATAVIDAKRPAVQAFLGQDVADLGTPPSPNDPMGWATGAPALHPPIDDDPAGLATGLDDLIDALQNQRPPLYSVRDARDNMEILLAGYRSMATGREVTLPLTRGSSE